MVYTTLGFREAVRRVLSHVAVVLLFTAVFLFISYSDVFAGVSCRDFDLVVFGSGNKLNNECSEIQSDGTYNPIDAGNCFFGCCGICDSNAKSWDGWANPRAEVLYMPMAWSSTPWALPVYKKFIDLQKCRWIVGVRFCVRPVKPYQSDYGNTSGEPKICAYEDPCDGMDPPDGNCAVHSEEGPFHENTPNNEAMSVAKAAKWGAVGGAALGPAAAAFGAALGAMVAGIMSHYNHVVVTNIGCMPRRIGPIPPTWTNNAWFNNNIPDPTFVEQSDSKFGSIKYKMKWCTKSATDDHQVACLMAADADFEACPSGTSNCDRCLVAAKGTRCERSVILNPRACKVPNASDPNLCTTAYSDKTQPAMVSSGVESNDNAYYRDCKSIGYYNSSKPADSTRRKYCLSVTKEEPQKVTATMTAYFGGPDSDAETAPNPAETIQMAKLSFKRPGYIPVPTLVESASSKPTAVKVDLSLRGETITLEEDPWLITKVPPQNSKKDSAGNPVAMSTSGATAWQKNGSLHNIKFAISRPCVPGSMKKSTTASVAAAADNTLAKTAPVGSEYCDKFSKAYICVDGYDTGPYTVSDKSTNFAIQAPPNVLKVKNVAFNNNNKMATPEPATSTSAQQVAYIKDVYISEATNNTIRPITNLEAGLCLDIASAVTEYTTPGSYTYTVPEFCRELKVDVWGAGGAGKFVPGQTGVGNDNTGGAGGHVYGNATLDPVLNYEVGVVVGAGGQTMGADGTNSVIVLGIAEGGDTLASAVANAGAGSSATGGAGSRNGLAADFTVVNGPSGQSTTSIPAVAGPAADGSTAQSAGQCGANMAGTYQAPFGGGGCSKDDGDGAWGKGGDGKVQMSCTKHSVVVSYSEQVYSSTGNFDYNIPSACQNKEVIAEIWGAGASGRAVDGGDGDCNAQSSGGEGAYAKLKLPIPLGVTSLKVTVGEGGSNRVAGNSSVYINGNDPYKAIAEGGNINNGGGTSITWPSVTTLSARNGINGACSSDADAGRSYGATAGGTNAWIGGWSCDGPSRYSPPVAGGGCHCDDCNGDEPWGYGGNGKVILRCIVLQE